MCVNGASWVRENIMEKYPDEEITVYAVWFNMIGGDQKEGWDPKVLADRRVTHYWDEKRVLGKWVAKNVGDCKHLGPIDWDSYYLFDKDGKWVKTFGNVKACGTPILKAADKLEHAIIELFESHEDENLTTNK